MTATGRGMGEQRKEGAVAQTHCGSLLLSYTTLLHYSALTDNPGRGQWGSSWTTTSSMNAWCVMYIHILAALGGSTKPDYLCPIVVECPPTAAYPVVKEGLDTEQAGVEVSLRRKASRNRREPSEQVWLCHAVGVSGVLVCVCACVCVRVLCVCLCARVLVSVCTCLSVCVTNRPPCKDRVFVGVLLRRQYRVVHEVF